MFCSDSETENISVARTSTPVKTYTATSETTPINSSNTDYRVEPIFIVVSPEGLTYRQNFEPHIMYSTESGLPTKSKRLSG